MFSFLIEIESDGDINMQSRIVSAIKNRFIQKTSFDIAIKKERNTTTKKRKLKEYAITELNFN